MQCWKAYPPSLALWHHAQQKKGHFFMSSKPMSQAGLSYSGLSLHHPSGWRNFGTHHSSEGLVRPCGPLPTLIPRSALLATLGETRSRIIEETEAQNSAHLPRSFRSTAGPHCPSPPVTQGPCWRCHHSTRNLCLSRVILPPTKGPGMLSSSVGDTWLNPTTSCLHFQISPSCEHALSPLPNLELAVLE